MTFRTMYFSGLANHFTDEGLSDEADILGVDPRTIGSFTIQIWRVRTSADTRLCKKGFLEDGIKSFNTAKIDPKNFKKHGIAYSTG